ncbi:MAG: O-antigen ligase family protein [Oscillospiraceae bacterium]|nr:O-antigen ligase family protein [Oscillospiraceae bacterium]
MAAKKQGAPKSAMLRKNTPLLFVMLLLIPAHGGYYNFEVFLCGAVLCVLLLADMLGKRRLCIPAGAEAWCLYGLCASMLLSVPFAVSAGMAFAGFWRILTWVLFFLCAATYTDAERRGILDAVAYEGAILSAVCIAAFLYDSAAGFEDANRRIDGLFEYANTWSLFLLVCLILLALRERRRKVDYAAMASLLCGIYLSGSRGIFLLTALLGIAYAAWQLLRRRRLLPVLLGALAVAALGALSVLLSGGMVLDRLRAITLHSSSLNGRLLYYLDGLSMIAAHPLGIGRGGYLYLQSVEQTGVYTLHFIHNEYLQCALDGGILGGLCMAGLAAALFFRRALPLRERVAVLAIAAHAMIDFDLQFTAVAFLLLLCGAGGKTREFAVSRRKVCAVGCTALAVVFSYFTLAYFLDYSGNHAAAYAMVPHDLSVAEERLMDFSSVAAAQGTADEIIDATDLSMLAWDCKFADAVQRVDYAAMAETKYQYLRLNRYRMEVYGEFAELLENACAQSLPDELERYKILARLGAKQLEEVKGATSPLAYRIADKPELGRSAEIIAQLMTISERED